MIKIVCSTNLDLINEEWPDELPRVPCVGEEIFSKTSHNGFRLSLEVIQVRWKYSIDGYYPEIELHDKRHLYRSVPEFHQWYETQLKQHRSNVEGIVYYEY